MNLSNASWDFPPSLGNQITPYVPHIQAWAYHALKGEIEWQIG